MKILVTGGAGFIGSNIANTLSRDKNNTVIAFDDLSLGRPTNLSRNVKFVKGSIMDYELSRKRMRLHFPFCRKKLLSNV